MEGSPSRKPLHERSDSANTKLAHTITPATSRAVIRIVPNTPPQLLETGIGKGKGKEKERPATGTNNEAKDARYPGERNEENEIYDEHRDAHDAHDAHDAQSRQGLEDVAVYSRTPFPTHPSHVFLAPGIPATPANISLRLPQGREKLQTRQDVIAAPVAEFQSGAPALTGLSLATPLPTQTTTQPPRNNRRNSDSDTGSARSKPRPPSKKRLHIHKDNKTFSLLHDDPGDQSESVVSGSPISALSRTSSFDSLASEALHVVGRSNSVESCLISSPATPNLESKHPISEGSLTTASPWNYQLVGGLRKVPKTPELKKKGPSESPLPPVPEASDRPSGTSHDLSHDLSTRLSFRSTNTVSSVTSASDTANYKVYESGFVSSSDLALQPPSTSDSNYQIIGPSSVPSSNNSNYELIGPPSEHPSNNNSDYELIGPPSEHPSNNNSNYELIGPPSEPSSTGSVIYRPRTAASENSNYELYGDPSPAGSSIHLVSQPKYSHESLVVPPLKPKNKRSNEGFGYYKQRSRETLRTGSLTSINTVLSQQEATRAIVGSGSLIQLPILSEQPVASSSWAEKSGTNLTRSHMNEHPHQWSSQLSTVLSVSEGETGRASREWASSDNGRRSVGSGFPSTPSRTSHRVLSISSSLALEESRSEDLIPPEPAFTRSRRHQSTGSVGYIQDVDEDGDGITDMQDLRNRPSRTLLSQFFNSGSSSEGHTNTMLSASSSRANSTRSNRSNNMVAASIPTWARLYYGSGERRYLGAPGSSTESTSVSRSSSFRTGSPNTDHFPLSIYSPRRRPRDVQNDTRPSTRGSLQINPVPIREDGQDINYNSRRHRAWSLSSVWSPHLRMDRQAPRHNMWNPPSVNWSTESGSFGRRNIQIVMFVMGFIFPFTWMVASFLPLPPNPVAEMQEREAQNNSSNLDTADENFEEYIRRFGAVDEKRFQNARWWRNLNRWMSLVGVLIIAAIVILVVVSLKEGWTKT